MTRTALIAITLLSAVGTPVVVGAAGGLQAAVAPVSHIEPARQHAAASAHPCLRRVKIVYAGYGEGERACSNPDPKG